ncbi:MAG: major capsid protein [Ruminococcaceae bacterium]|nr:major capsid protein [Oscillospiraceae bacterium]
MAYDIYTTRHLAGIIKRTAPVTTFLRDTFFRNVKTFDTEKVLFDVVMGGREVAPFVHPVKGGKVISNQGYETKEYTAPLVSPEMATTADELMKRAPGEDLDSELTPTQRGMGQLGEDLSKMDDSITRREEVMCAELLFSGGITVKGEGIDEYIDFGFSNFETLDTKWSDPASDPFADIQRWYDEISKNGLVKADIMIMSQDVANAFINNPNVKEQLDVKNMDIATIAPKALKNGARYIGTYPMLGISFYSYSEYYMDDWTDPANPTLKPYVPDGTVALLSTQANFSRLYGAVTYFDPKTEKPVTYKGKRVPESFLSSNHRTRTLRLSARPLMVAHELMSWYVGTVL